MRYLEARARLDAENKMRAATGEDKRTKTPAFTAPASKARMEVEDLAAVLGVDLATVQGTGKKGAVTVLDVQAAAKPLPLPPVAPFLPDPVVIDLVRPLSPEETGSTATETPADDGS